MALRPRGQNLNDRKELAIRSTSQIIYEPTGRFLRLNLTRNDISNFGTTDRAVALNIPVECELNRASVVVVSDYFSRGVHP